jgi:hypothetical protein
MPLTRSFKDSVPAKSPMRMFGPRGNPNARNHFAVIRSLQADAGISLHVRADAG